jgi:acyl carrier protein|tara:strand:- start:108 stop:332 length:225 start_codon:yes stop_codon:yes gene_type:complete
MKIQLINIVKEALDIEEETIDLNTQFDSLDTWDSLGKLSLIALIDESFNVQISDKEFNSFETLDDLYTALKSKN